MTNQRGASLVVVVVVLLLLVLLVGEDRLAVAVVAVDSDASVSVGFDLDDDDDDNDEDTVVKTFQQRERQTSSPLRKLRGGFRLFDNLDFSSSSSSLFPQQQGETAFPGSDTSHSLVDLEESSSSSSSSSLPRTNQKENLVEEEEEVNCDDLVWDGLFLLNFRTGVRFRRIRSGDILVPAAYGANVAKLLTMEAGFRGPQQPSRVTILYPYEPYLTQATDPTAPFTIPTNLAAEGNWTVTVTPACTTTTTTTIPLSFELSFVVKGPEGVAKARARARDEPCRQANPVLDWAVLASTASGDTSSSSSTLRGTNKKAAPLLPGVSPAWACHPVVVDTASQTNYYPVVGDGRCYAVRALEGTDYDVVLGVVTTGAPTGIINNNPNSDCTTVTQKNEFVCVAGSRSNYNNNDNGVCTQQQQPMVVRTVPGILYWLLVGGRGVAQGVYNLQIQVDVFCTNGQQQQQVSLPPTGSSSSSLPPIMLTPAIPSSIPSIASSSSLLPVAASPAPSLSSSTSSPSSLLLPAPIATTTSPLSFQPTNLRPALSCTGAPCAEFASVTQSVFYEFRGDGSRYVVDTRGTTPFDTVLAVLQGPQCATATCVVANDNVGDNENEVVPAGATWSRVTFTSVRGQPYWLVVGFFVSEIVGSGVGFLRDFQVRVTFSRRTTGEPGPATPPTPRPTTTTPPSSFLPTPLLLSSIPSTEQTFLAPPSSFPSRNNNNNNNPALTLVPTTTTPSLVPASSSSAPSSNSNPALERCFSAFQFRPFARDPRPFIGRTVDAPTLGLDGPGSDCRKFDPVTRLEYVGWLGDGATYRVDTNGSRFDTVLGILEGVSCANATCVVSNDDATPFGDWSQIEIATVAGVQYWLVVGGFATQTGIFRVNRQQIELPAPTGVPNEFPTGSTTPSQAPVVPSPRTATAECLASMMVTNRATLNQIATPQAAALDWIVNNDAYVRDNNLACPNKEFVDRYVLAVFYFAMGGEDWTVCGQADPSCSTSTAPANGWLSPVTVCLWYQVRCTQEFNFTGLLFGELLPSEREQTRLVGTFPSELGYLSDVTVWNLRDMEIRGTIGTIFDDWSRLQNLLMDNNRLSGTLPLLSIETHPNVAMLHLSNNRFTGTIPRQYGGLTNLVELHLVGAQLAGSIPRQLAGLTNLVSLDISNSGALAGDLPAGLFDLTNLGTLHLENNPFLEGEFSPSIGKLTDLTSLRLGNTRISGTLPSELGTLRLLRDLSLNAARFSGPIPEELRQLTLLRIVNLSNNLLTGSIPDIWADLTLLEVLTLENNNLVGEITAATCAGRGSDFGEISRLTVDCLISCACCDALEECNGDQPTLAPTP